MPQNSNDAVVMRYFFCDHSVKRIGVLDTTWIPWILDTQNTSFQWWVSRVPSPSQKPIHYWTTFNRSRSIWQWVLEFRKYWASRRL